MLETMRTTIEACLKDNPTKPINVILRERDLRLGCLCYSKNGKLLPNGFYKTYRDKSNLEYRHSLFSECRKKHGFLKCFGMWLIGRPVSNKPSRPYQYPKDKPTIVRFETKNGELVMLHTTK